MANHEVFTGLRKKLPKSRQKGELPNLTILPDARIKPPWSFYLQNILQNIYKNFKYELTRANFSLKEI